MQKIRIIYLIFLILVLVTVVPMVVSNLLITSNLRESLETQEQKYQTREVVAISEEIKNYVTRYRQQLDKIADAMAIAMETNPGRDIFAYMGETGRINRYYEEDKQAYRTILILNAQAKGAGVQPPGLPESVSHGLFQAHQEAMRGRKTVGEAYYLDNINESVILLATPILVGGTSVGSVEALISLQPIYEALKERGSDTEMAYVVDKKGRIILHSTASETIARRDYKDKAIVAKFMREPVRLTMSYPFMDKGTEASWLGTVAPVGEPDWGVVVQKLESAAYAAVSRIVNRTVLTMLIALAVALMLGGLLAQTLSGPISKLAHTAEELAQGNFKVRASLAAGSSEIAALAGSFNHMASQIEQYIERLVQAAQENRELFVSSIRMIATAIDAKDPYTRGHSDRVCAYSLGLAREMGLKGGDLDEVRIAAMLHDVGKIGIDDRVLRKPSALNDDEFAMIKAHPFTGAQIMQPVPQLKRIIPGIKYHHENWGGGGYPEGLKGAEIPSIARIIAVADTFDAMTTDRPYQRAMSPRYAAEKIRSLVGKRFDPQIVEAFLKAFEKGEIRVEHDTSSAA
jgi:HD-GYP domain-containing protein (c-di-GMP phosphodiesterase class II)